MKSKTIKIILFEDIDIQGEETRINFHTPLNLDIGRNSNDNFILFLL